MARERLTTRETADRLGVKPATVYAYVSRGLLSSRPDAGRGSTFDRAEVEALARAGRRAGSSAGAVPAVTTTITLIEGDRYYFRGVDAAELASREFETVAWWLWTGDWTPGTRFTAPADVLAEARAVIAALPARSGAVDRLRVATLAAAAADPLRFALTPDTVCAAGATLLAVLVEALPVIGEPAGAAAPLARRLWSRLTAHPAADAAVACLNTAMTLLVDHDLAASTFAARVAASARAHPYAVVSSGLGALDGPLHGAASEEAHRMLRDAAQRGVGAVVAEHLRTGRRVPGLGHRVYRGTDPRAAALFARLAALPEAAGAVELARGVETVTGRHRAVPANVDLAVAALTLSFGMPADAGETIFAVSRVAGWVAHALEEYAEAPLRMRPGGIYRGPRPPRPVPGP